jgi:alpha-mannosidase
MAKQDPAPSSVEKQYLTVGFHSDVVWLEDQRDYARVLMGCTRQYLDGCRADELYGVFLHELTYLKPYIDTHPGEGEYIRGLIAAGRVGTGGAHSMPAETVISGEALLRNFLHGRRYHEAVLGDRPWVLHLWDVFGHVSQLPQIAAGCGFGAVIWSKDIRGARPLFYQEGPDGTRLLVRRVSYGFSERGMAGDLEHLRSCLLEAASLGLPADLRLDCNDFRPPRSWIIGRCQELRELRPPIIVSGQAHRHYFQEIKAAEEQGRLFIPVTARDFEWHHQGTGVAHIDLKIANRLAENALVNAEKFATVASQLGARYPWEALDKGWRQLLFAQHHDAITGPCCDRSYFDLLNGYREALELAEEVLNRALTYLAGGVNTARSGQRDLAALVVFNPLNWERTDLVETEIVLPRAVQSFALESAAGEPVPFEVVDAQPGGGRVRRASLRFLATVPSFGYAVYYVVPSTAPLPMVRRLRAADLVELENEFYRLTISAQAGGGIVSLYDKQLRRELINSEVGPGNELISIEEDFTHHPEPPWELMTKLGGRRYHSRHYKARLQVWQGPVSSRVQVRGPFKDCRRVQEIVLLRGLRRIEFTLELQRYRGHDHLHVIAFPVRVAGAVPVFDDRFSCLVKRKSRGYLDFRTWQWRNYSGCGARRLYQWLDLSGSVLLRFGDGQAINVGSTSIVIRPQREAEEIAYALQSALIGKGVPCTIFYDDGERSRRAGLPHEDSTMPRESPNEDLPWGTSFRFLLDVGETNTYLRELLRKLPAQVVAAWRQERRRTGVGARLVKEEGIELELWEDPPPYPWPPLPTLIISASSWDDLRAAVHNLAHQIARAAVAHLPSQLNAAGELAWEDHGVALLNRGTPLGAVENNDTLALILMHAVRWSRAHLDFRPVAEHKTHRFEYALYPHPGNWRAGRVPWAAYEYNNRLLAVQSDPGPGFWPNQMSFLTCEPLGSEAWPAAGSWALAAASPQAPAHGAGGAAQGAQPTAPPAREEPAAPAANGQGASTGQPQSHPTSELPAVQGQAKAWAPPIMTALKPAGFPLAGYDPLPLGRPEEIVVRCYEPTGVGTAMRLRWFAGLQRAQRTNFLEQPQEELSLTDGAVPVELGGFKIETLRLAAIPPSVQLGQEELGRRLEPGQPVYFAHWEHNLGAEPLAFSPIGISLRGDVQLDTHVPQGGYTVNPLTLGLVNNLSVPVAGKVEFELPEGWRTLPQEVTYALEPRSSVTVPVTLLFESPLRRGAVKARLSHEGQTYEAVLEVGPPARLQWDVRPVRGSVLVRLRSDYPQAIEVDAFAVVPHELWGEMVEGAALGEVSPRYQRLVVPAGGRVQWRLAAPAGVAGWLCVKLAYHGRVEYKQVRLPAR